MAAKKKVAATPARKKRRGRPPVIQKADHLAIAELVERWRRRGYPLVSKVTSGQHYHKVGACLLVALRIGGIIGPERIAKIYKANRARLPSDAWDARDIPRAFLRRLRAKGIDGWNPFDGGDTPFPNPRTWRHYQQTRFEFESPRFSRWRPRDGSWCTNGFDA